MKLPRVPIPKNDEPLTFEEIKNLENIAVELERILVDVRAIIAQEKRYHMN